MLFSILGLCDSKGRCQHPGPASRRSRCSATGAKGAKSANGETPMTFWGFIREKMGNDGIYSKDILGDIISWKTLLPLPVNHQDEQWFEK